jgi:transcriptional regulator with XRE-family HTH domain
MRASAANDSKPGSCKTWVMCMPLVNHSLPALSTTADRIVARIRRMASIGDRLRDERLAQGKTQQQLADLAGVSKQGVSAIELGKTKKSEADTLAPIAKGLGLSLDWLRTGRGPKYHTESSDDDWAGIRASTQGLALGDGVDLDEFAETHKLKFRANGLRRKGLYPDKLEVYYGSGYSMEPRIHDGDALLINTQEREPVHDAIFMVCWQGAYYAKRLKRFGRQWFLCSDNTSDPKWSDPVAVEDHHDFNIVGRVRWIGSWED